MPAFEEFLLSVIWRGRRPRSSAVLLQADSLIPFSELETGVCILTKELFKREQLSTSGRPRNTAPVSVCALVTGRRSSSGFYLSCSVVPSPPLGLGLYSLSSSCFQNLLHQEHLQYSSQRIGLCSLLPPTGAGAHHSPWCWMHWASRWLPFYVNMHVSIGLKIFQIQN